MDRVIEGQIDARHHAHARNLLLGLSLIFLNRVLEPRLAAHVAPKLHVVEGKIGLSEIRADGLDQVGEAVGEERCRLPVDVRFALVPEHSGNLSAHRPEAPQHGSIK